MKLGRNDSCHCGSGRKYKKCCLEKDEAALRAQQQQTVDDDDFADEVDDEPDDELEDDVDDEDFDELDDEDSGELKDEEAGEFDDEEAAPDKDAKDPDAPKIDVEAANRRWEEFVKADYEGRIALFTQTLEEPRIMDDESAFSMLNELYPAIAKRNEHDRYEALVEQLRARLPKVYEKGAHYYLENRLNSAVVTGRFERVPAPMNELAKLAGVEIETFDRAVTQLAYYGRLAILLEAMRIAWPEIKPSAAIVPWGVEEISVQAVQFSMFDYLEQNGFPGAGTPELFERLRSYHDVETEKINQIIALLSGQAGREWRREDFVFKPHRRKSPDRDEIGLVIPAAIEQNLFDLSVEFQGYLRREENVPLTKGEMARAEIVKYLLNRLNGKLEPRLSMLESAINRPNPKTNPPEFYLGKGESAVHWLYPDRGTFERHLIGLLHFLNPQHYHVAATFELMPRWLRFLESRRLIDAAKHAQALRELQGLQQDVLKLFENYKTDPGLYEAVKNVCENAPQSIAGL